MADNAPVPAATPTPAPSQAANVNVANNAVGLHPEVAQKAPQVMADAIASGNPDVVNTVAATQSIAPYAQALADHQKNYNSQSVWGTILGDAKGILNNVVQTVQKVPGVGTIMNWANKPLQEIQKDYKFLHSVYTDHSV